jgi:hypothetical protein
LHGLRRRQRAHTFPEVALRERRKITVWGAQKPMRTYTHGVIGYVLYAKRSRQEKKLAVIGGILPDVFLALGFVPHYLENFTQSAIVVGLHTLLHHSDVHLITVSLHSFVIVGPCLILSYVLYKPALPLFVGMLAHGTG